MKACRQVEGLFLSHLMQAMDRPAFGEGVLGSSRATGLFRTQRNQAIADEMGLRGELGLAEMLYNDLTHQAGAAGAERSGEAAEPVEGADLR
jgi:Rod binding domain-containing protein